MLGPDDATQGGKNTSFCTGATCHGARIQLCLEEIDLFPFIINQKREGGSDDGAGYFLGSFSVVSKMKQARLDSLFWL